MAPATPRATDFNSSTPPVISGYRMAYSDTFDSGLSDDRWGRYGWGLQRPGHGGMGRYDVNNVTVSDGTMKLRYRYANGEWTSAGVSGAPGYTAERGRWEVRAKFPRGQGMAFAFLLWPKSDSWPPEVDFLEGGLNNPHQSAFYHDKNPYQRWDAQLDDHDLTGWHTYGVIMEDDRLIYTLDGRPWAVMETGRVTREQMWIGFQTAAIDPNAPEARWHLGGVPGGVPNALTPADASIQIDWVAHYEQV